MGNQPNLKYVPAPEETKGILYIGASDAFNIPGRDIYVWNGRGQSEFVGVHMPNIRNNRDTDGLSRLAELITRAYQGGYLISYELPPQARKAGKGKFRELDSKERVSLRNRLGLRNLSLAA
ncbi:MAG TPA: hypothetical protein VJK07_01600 [Candidatus Nanoarchaeia archaeon]|nr:hypothetical protein [Candidatus Nanoarchaeia archaeon]